MRITRHPLARWAAVGSAAVVLAIGLSPLGAGAADHLDSPTVSSMGAADLTDIYAFSTSNMKSSVLIASVNPGAGALANSTVYFGSGVRYDIKVDTTGDAKADVDYQLRFGKPDHGSQAVTIWRNGKTWGNGMTGRTIGLGGGAKLWAGLRDDPFFFDLDAFKGSVLGATNGRALCDSKAVDFFKGLNVSAIVLMVPNAELGGNGRALGVWATTRVYRDGQWAQVDQMGRPGINTVFNNHLVAGNDANANAYKELFNRTLPSEQAALGFKANVIATLKAVSAGPLGVTGKAYTDAQAGGLADLLIADTLTYKTGDRSGFLNGRRLADDVIDTLLQVGTNNPAASDCVANDSTFSSGFPFLGAPN